MANPVRELPAHPAFRFYGIWHHEPVEDFAIDPMRWPVVWVCIGQAPMTARKYLSFTNQWVDDHVNALPSYGNRCPVLAPLWLLPAERPIGQVGCAPTGDHRLARRTGLMEYLTSQ